MTGAIAIVEDHDTMRHSLKSLLESATKLEVQHAFTSGEEALETFDRHERPDLLLVDLSLPEMSGIDLIRQVKQRWPEIKCLVFSGQTDPSYVDRSFEAGAEAFILKGHPGEILEALNRVSAAERYVSPALSRACP